MDASMVVADGGCIGRNPSPHGGVWAYLHVSEAGEVIREDSGLILAGVGELAVIANHVVSNNHSEYFALARALRCLPAGWSGRVMSDSQITLGRFFWGWAHNNIPYAWEREMRKITARLGEVEVVLLDGHPTKKQLEAGIGKRKNPCSPWNVKCDQECQRLAKEFLVNLNERQIAAQSMYAGALP